MAPNISVSDCGELVPLATDTLSLSKVIVAAESPETLLQLPVVEVGYVLVAPGENDTDRVWIPFVMLSMLFTELLAV